MGYLTTRDAAHYCGYRSTAGLRKAAFMGRVRPAGRASTNGTNLWLVEELDAFMRGELPARREGAVVVAIAAIRDDRIVADGATSTLNVVDDDTAAGNATESNEADEPATLPDPTLAGPRPQRRAEPDFHRRPLTTRQLAARFRVRVEEVREWLARGARWNGDRLVASFEQFVATRRPGQPWRAYMRIRRIGTSRPPTAAKRSQLTQGAVGHSQGAGAPASSGGRRAPASGRRAHARGGRACGS